jgi:Arc/MetJ-type ribon-helix-helix transcriptional regulator
MTIHLPPRLAEQLETYIQSGWFSDLDTLVVEALRRYLETHPLERQEHFLRQDVEWGLRGHD